MKAYIKNPKPNYRYPEDMEEILSYLKENGDLNIQCTTVESYWYAFSNERYAAGWIGVNNQTLEEFADYLSEVEI